MSTRIVFSEKYTVKGGSHVFRSDKFAAALKLLLKEKIVSPADILEPARPSRADLLPAHSPAWVKKILSGRLSPADLSAAELKGLRGTIEAHLMNTGGTILAARLALETGLGVNCGGGGHHAFRGGGAGFCLLNDIAVAVRWLQRRKKIKRALIIDLDAHQGDGTASIFGKDRSVFTYSVHQRDLYPEVKQRGSLDRELPAGTGDAAYMKLLKADLPAVFKKARPDIVIYNAGVDVYEHDLLGGLRLTMAGVRRRDELVFAECFKRKVPVALVLSGGYAAKFSDTVRLHSNTIKAALDRFSAR